MSRCPRIKEENRGGGEEKGIKRIGEPYSKDRRSMKIFKFERDEKTEERISPKTHESTKFVSFAGGKLRADTHRRGDRR